MMCLRKILVVFLTFPLVLFGGANVVFAANDLSHVSDKGIAFEVCSFFKKYDYVNNKNFIEEAKKRDLNCSSFFSHFTSNLHFWSNENICELAIIDGKWNKSQNFKHVVKEAFKRKLKCEKRPQTHMTKHANSYVCDKATKWSRGVKYWNDLNKDFIIEAKERGLDCGAIKAEEDNSIKIAANQSNDVRKCSTNNSEKCNKITGKNLYWFYSNSDYSKKWGPRLRFIVFYHNGDAKPEAEAFSIIRESPKFRLYHCIKTSSKYLEYINQKDIEYKSDYKELNKGYNNMLNYLKIDCGKEIKNSTADVSEMFFSDFNYKKPSNRPLASVSDSTVCYNATTTSGSTKVWNDRNENFVGEANYRGLNCGVKDNGEKIVLKKIIQPKNQTYVYDTNNINEWSNVKICSFLNKFTGKHIYSERVIKKAKKYANNWNLECVNATETVIASKSKSKPSTTNAELEKAKREAEELRKKLAALEKQKKEQQSKPKTIVTNKPESEFPLNPIPVNFPSVSVKRDDIAVIIGNANYKKQGKDIPNVNPAYADSEGIKQYFMKAKGVREGNIIYLKDATNAQLLSVFGNEKSHKGKLFNYIKPNKSNVYIYYAGHGAPGKEGDAYLVPTDSDSQTIEFTGYPLSTLYSNLGKLHAKSMTVILEACFSGGSQSGSLISKASPIVIQPKKTIIPANVKVIAAGSESQMASWEEDSSHSLFTKYFLKAMSGEGDSNKDGKVSDAELKEYLSDTMTYFARRYYGRDQKVQIHNGG